MKTEKEINTAITSCEKAQMEDSPKLCPIYPEESTLDCINCTCRDAWNWMLKG